MTVAMYSSFITQVLRELQNGAKIPPYFGCLSPLITTNTSFDLQAFSELQTEPQPSIASDLLDFIPESPPHYPPPSRYADDSFRTEPKYEPELPQSDPPSDFQSTEEAPPIIEQEPEEIHPPSNNPSFVEQYQSSVQRDSVNTEFNEEEERIPIPLERPKPKPQPKKSLLQYEDYARQFRSLTMDLYEKFWPAIETTVPRLQQESKLFANFRRSKFEKFESAIISKSEETKTGKIRFVRRESDDSF